MLDLNNLRKEKHEGLCKILDLVLVVLFAVFFILSLFPYYSVSEGEYVVSRGYGAEDSVKAVKAGEDDSWSLLGYVGFPYNHTSVEDWQEKMYKVNKDAISDNEDAGFDGLFGTLAGKLGMTKTVTDKKGNETVCEYQPLDVPGVTTKTISIKQVGAILFLDIFAIIGIIILLLKKGIVRAVYSVIWGVIGVLCMNMNYLLCMGNTAIRPIMLVIVIVALVVAVIATVFYAIDAKSRAAYLKSVSAAYA